MDSTIKKHKDRKQTKERLQKRDKLDLEILFTKFKKIGE